MCAFFFWRGGGGGRGREGGGLGENIAWFFQPLKEGLAKKEPY